jgi:hypothetical protein
MFPLFICSARKVVVLVCILAAVSFSARLAGGVFTDSAEGLSATFFNDASGGRAARLGIPRIDARPVSVFGIRTGFKQPEISALVVELWVEECDAEVLNSIFEVFHSWPIVSSGRLVLHFPDSSSIVLEDWIPMKRMWGFRSVIGEGRGPSSDLRWMGAERGFVPYQNSQRLSEPLEQWAESFWTAK